MLILRGPLAHTHFRIERLLAKINQIVPQIIGLNTEFVHFLEGTGLNGAVSISNKENKILLDLLNYGPTAESLQLLEYRYNLILITPRVGGVSEWSMKATEIFHHCGLSMIRRIERGIAYYVEASDKITYGDLQAIAKLLYDPRLETVFYDLQEAKYLFKDHNQPQFANEVDIIQRGRAALIQDTSPMIETNLFYPELETHVYDYHIRQLKMRLETKQQNYLSGKASFSGTRMENFSMETLLNQSGAYAQYNNALGRPHIYGYFRSGTEAKASGPWALNGGIGYIPYYPREIELKAGMLLGVLGSPSQRAEDGDPEMARRIQEVMNTCWQQDTKNPIIYFDEIGARGLGNAVARLLKKYDKGARIELRDIPSVNEGLAPQDLWCSPAKERVMLILDRASLATLQNIASREACPFAVIGEIQDHKVLQVYDRLANTFPVNLPVKALQNDEGEREDNEDKQEQEYEQEQTERTALPLDLAKIGIEEALLRLLHLPSIADKSALISISDRSVTGLVAREPMVGPWQSPVADCGVIARSFESYAGEALAMGERPRISSIDPEAGSRMAWAEAITNIAAASIADVSEIQFRREGWTELAFAPVRDIRYTLTPYLSRERGSTLLFIDLSPGFQRLGGSALAAVYDQMDVNTPDLNHPVLLKSFFAMIQRLNVERKILAYHDRSEGGLMITLCEMAFASHLGLYIDISELSSGSDPKALLFNEELGAVLQVLNEDVESILAQFYEEKIPCHVLGKIDKRDYITIQQDEEILFYKDRVSLQKKWSEMSFLLQALRDNPRCAKKQYEALEDVLDPGLNEHLTFKLEKVAPQKMHKNSQPRLAILREQGMSGQVEMAAAFEKVGFTTVDVHMNDLQMGHQVLKGFKGLIACGGFSYGDVLGAGQGWAKRILYNAKLRDQFAAFFEDKSTFTLGVCNGCQMLAALKDLIPGAELWPSFIQNYSEQFESRLCLVEVQDSPSILLHNMQGSRLLVPVAQGEGRAFFPKEELQEAALKEALITLRYVDHYGRKTKVYPANPSGSPLGIAALTNLDGRLNIMMPHPERAFLPWQYAWQPSDWEENAPWLQLFRNARLWV